jgi:hypothetical protein
MISPLRYLRQLVPLLALATAACGEADPGVLSSGSGAEGSGANKTPGSPSAGDPVDGATCTVTAATSTVSAPDEHGCTILARDASACTAERTAAGLSGAWLRFSCRVKLTVLGQLVTASADGRPDYKSFYFDEANACYEAFPSGKRNPNRIATESISVDVPLSPGGDGQRMQTAIVAIALNGVPIYGNFAAPGDDIFQEAATFDRCAGHPQGTGMYHYHSEPTSITADDDRFIGMMRDGYAIYGRKDSDGSYPALDQDGGHTGATSDSGGAAVYHYHVNKQTSTGARTAGQAQWFITAGRFHATPAACSGCK